MKRIHLNTRMRVKRIESQMSQKDIADKLGVARSTIAGIERGENPANFYLVLGIAGLFNTTSDSLFKKHPKLIGKFITKVENE